MIFMKGLSTILLSVILLVVGIIILLAIWSIFFVYNPTNSGTTVIIPTLNPYDTFNYSTYLLDSNPVDTTTYNDCDKLKNAIKYAIITGKPYEVDEIAYGNDLESSIPFPFIGNCLEEPIETEIANGLNQTVCNFKKITTNSTVGIPNYGGISDATSLSFENCIYYPFDNSVLSGDVGPKNEEVNLVPNTINLFYSPDYLYLRNGDYSHSSSLNNVTAFNSAYNGPGRLIIYVGNATSINGECKFNIYFCPRPAIAKSTDDSTISIFKLFKDLELYNYSYLPLPYYIRDLTQLASDTNGFPQNSKKVYYWNYYDIKLDSDYRVETIINAIKEGLYVSVLAKNYSWAHPHWDVSRDPTITKDRECWDSSYDALIDSPFSGSRTRSIRFNCGDDNLCSGILRIKIASRLDSKDINGDNKPETYFSGVISFSDVTLIQICGDNKIEGTEQCEPPLVINSTHCDQAWASCDYSNRRYGTRDGFGDCDNNCQCIEDSWNWGVVDGADYCANCPNHCGDKAQNCGEECDPGASPTGCGLGESCKADCTCGVLGTWPDSHDLLTENAKIGTIKYGALIISVLVTENIDSSGIDVVWYDLTNLFSSPIQRIDQNIKKEGAQSINSSLDYISFVFVDTSSNPITLSSININQFKNVTFYLMLNSSWDPSFSFDGYLQFIDANGKQANISLGSVPKDIWNSYTISLTDSNWQVDSGFDRTKVTYVKVGAIASTHFSGNNAWLDDFYFTK